MDVVGSTDGANSPGGLLARRGKNRNKKGLALGSEAAKPGTLMGASAADLLQAPAPLVGSSSSSLSSTMTSPVGSLGAATPRTSEGSSRPQPIQVAGSSRSNRTSIISLSSDTTSPLPSTPSLSSSSASSRSYHNQLNEQLATLELGVEFKIDLRNEDLQVLDELGCGNGGTVSRALHIPTKAIMAKKVCLLIPPDPHLVSCTDHPRNRSSTSPLRTRPGNRSSASCSSCTTARPLSSSRSTARTCKIHTSACAWSTWTEGEEADVWQRLCALRC